MHLDAGSLKIAVIVQARMGSERLPGKSMMKICGKPVLAIILERLQNLRHLALVVVATTVEKEDDLIADFCKREKIACFRGSALDVLDRYVKTARHFAGDVIVRITGDNPLLDPKIIDQVIDQFLEHYPNYDYVSNTLERTFPRGLDVEVFKKRALEEAYEQAFLSDEREHVTLYIWHHPELFSLGNLAFKENLSYLRLTLDTSEDFELINKIFEAYASKGFVFSLEETLLLLQAHPDWVKINCHIEQKKV